MSPNTSPNTNTNTNEIQAMQQRLDEIQALYREWLALQPKLEQARTEWQHSVAIMQKLETFYTNGEYGQLNDAVDAGADLDLATQGEYSVLSEDALWDALGEQDQQLWALLRFAVKHLDRFSDNDKN